LLELTTTTTGKLVTKLTPLWWVFGLKSRDKYMEKAAIIITKSPNVQGAAHSGDNSKSTRMEDESSAAFKDEDTSTNMKHEGATPSGDGNSNIVELPRHTQLIHFSVRLMMAKRGEECRTLRRWNTSLAENASQVLWKHPSSTTMAGILEDIPSGNELDILRQLTDISKTIETTKLKNKEQGKEKEAKGKEAEGKEVEGKEVEEKEAEGKEAEEKEVEGKKVEGKEVEGKKVEGKEAEGKEAKGKEAEGKEVEGKEAEGKEAEGKEAEEKEVEGKKVEGKEVEGKKVEGKKVEGKEIEGKEAKGKEAKGKKVQIEPLYEFISKHVDDKHLFRSVMYNPPVKRNRFRKKQAPLDGPGIT
jgi:hypothetical protein